MAKRISLREFQESLVRRLADAQSAPRRDLLGLTAGGDQWLVDLGDAGEILPVPPLATVPLAKAWFRGLANVRGNLLPIVDLKQFLEGERTVLHEGHRILLVRQPGGDVAVLIDELFGQRSFHDQQQVTLEDAGGHGLTDGRYAYFVDRAYLIDGQPWGIFSLDRLARTPEFRQAAA